MAINVKPLGDRVLVQPLEEKEVKKVVSSDNDNLKHAR